MLSSCSKKSVSKTASTSSSHTLKATDFTTFIANPGTINIVDFSATWCGPCQQLKPILASIANEHSDTVRLGIVDVDTEKDLAAQIGVRGIPDVRFYVNGKEVEKFTGGVPKKHIEQIIAKYSNSLTTPSPDITTPIPPAQPGAPAQPSGPAQPSAPAQPNAPAQPGSPAAPTPTILPSNGNPLPPGMSKQ